MIQNLRQIKLRIKAIESTQKITRAMEMVSAAKLNRIKNAFYAMKPYSAGLESALNDLLADIESPRHPLLEKREQVRNVALCAVTSDTGLCANYNNIIMELADGFLARHPHQGMKLIAVGKEAFMHFRRKGLSASLHAGLYGRYSSKAADDISAALVGMFTSGEVDEVHVAYTQFSPSLRHKPVIEKFLNIDYRAGTAKHFIFEPGARALLDAVLPAYILNRMRMILLDAFTAEHSARMLAMKMATDNAGELIDTLTLMRNKARQYAITKEVLEIAMSAEALKG